MTAQLPLLNKTALITGSSRGIGASIAYDLATRGASIIITYTSPTSTPHVDALVSRIHSLPHSPPTLAIRTDLRSPSAPATIFSALTEWRGEDFKIDILVNNAGVQTTKALGEISHEDIAAVYDLNVRAALLLTQALLPHIPPHSRIINISSVGARAGFAGLSLYCSSKAALESLTRCWAAELGGNGTTVNAVAPGPVESEMLQGVPREIVEMQMRETPVEQRVGKTGEVAGVVGWLAGSESAWVTGQTICVSGGWRMY